MPEIYKIKTHDGFLIDVTYDKNYADDIAYDYALNNTFYWNKEGTSSYVYDKNNNVVSYINSWIEPKICIEQFDGNGTWQYYNEY